jgi:NAD-dependent deacetylase
VAACREDLSRASLCAACGEIDCLRPHVVWFGEMPFHMAEIERALDAADWFVSIGTSGRVYPAAGFVRIAKYAGARTLELNLDPSDQSECFDESRLGPAGQRVPEWVRQVLGQE